MHINKNGNVEIVCGRKIVYIRVCHFVNIMRARGCVLREELSTGTFRMLRLVAGAHSLSIRDQH